MNKIYTTDGRMVTEETPHGDNEPFRFWSVGYFSHSSHGRDPTLRVWTGKTWPSPYAAIEVPREVDCPKNWVLV